MSSKKTVQETLEHIQLVDNETFEDFDPALRKAFQVHDSIENKDYSKVKIRKDSILLSGDKTFATLQGEGPTIGMPCVFCRLHVCNLRCTWCDAFYTWNPNSKEFWTEGARYSFKECASLIERSWKGTFPRKISKRVIFSGGEPLIQKTQIDEVIKELYKNGYWFIEIETNGTLMPTQFQLDRCQFNCSPKLRNSGNENASRAKPNILRALTQVDTTFKFVCSDENDLIEIEEDFVPYIDRNKIIIMPEGITEEEITPHARALYEPVMIRGWRMTPRFQAIFADGARRGV